MASPGQHETMLEDLPFELIEEIASYLPNSRLRRFRLSSKKAAAAGRKPLLSRVPTELTCPRSFSGFEQPCEQLDQLIGIMRLPSVVNIITTFTIDRGALELHVLSQFHLPKLKKFSIKQLDVTQTQAITVFLSNHSDILTKVELKEVDIICAGTDGTRGETIPSEWRTILTTIKDLPKVTDLVIMDIGYYNQEQDLRYKIWIDQESIRENEASRMKVECFYDAIIRAKAAVASTRTGVQSCVDAVLRSTGRKAFKFMIPYN